MRRIINNPWVFWPIWALTFCVALPLWVYGELGTIGYGFPYAPLCWLISAVMVVGLGVFGAAKYLGDI